jgi:SAM-dependent methyltransferase
MPQQANIPYWEKRWQSALDRSPLQRRRLKDGMRRWNKMAADFVKRTAHPQALTKRQETIQWLKDQGALAPGARVLDIGAGPGNWSLLLAQTAAQVTALEPAEAMAEILERRIEAEGITNIVIDRRTWQAVALDKDHWQGAFDLVFAAMTPGIDGPANLYKMTAASCSHCYLSAFAGQGWHRWYGDLWRAVFDESLDGHANDIIHPFNLVYAMGYRPGLRFAFWERETDVTREEALQECCTHLEGYTEITDEIRAKVAAFVDGRCQNGRFKELRRGCQGMMVWNVNQRVMDASEVLP